MSKILLVDDDPNLLRMMKRSLEFEGYQVITASDGQQGFEIFQKSQPDLVILDIMMPYVDGFEACRQIRTVSDVPILMLTARDDVEDIIKALDLGADDYLTKTFEPNILLTHVQVLLRRAQDE